MVLLNHCLSERIRTLVDAQGLTELSQILAYLTSEFGDEHNFHSVLRDLRSLKRASFKSWKEFRREWQIQLQGLKIQRELALSIGVPECEMPLPTESQMRLDILREIRGEDQKTLELQIDGGLELDLDGFAESATTDPTIRRTATSSIFPVRVDGETLRTACTGL